jgi:hypothetical protein
MKRNAPVSPCLDERLGGLICRAAEYAQMHPGPGSADTMKRIAIDCMNLIVNKYRKYEAARQIVIRLHNVNEDEGLRAQVQRDIKVIPRVKSFDAGEMAKAIIDVIDETKLNDRYTMAMVVMTMVHAWKTCGAWASRMVNHLKWAFPETQLEQTEEGEE